MLLLAGKFLCRFDKEQTRFRYLLQNIYLNILNDNFKQKTKRIDASKASKHKQLTHTHEAILKAMKKGAKSCIVNSLLTLFVQSVRENICSRYFPRRPQANTFPYRPHSVNK